VTFLVGEDDYLKRERVCEQKRESPGPFNHEAFDGGECSAGEIISACSTLPFGTGFRVIVVGNADGLSEKGREALLEYMSDPSPTARLLLLFNKLDRRSRLFREAQKRGWVRSCARLPDGKLAAWLREKARADYGKDLSMAVARSLVELAGPDMNALVNELEKISLYVGDRRDVRAEDVAEIVSARREPDIWALVEAVADKDERRALSIYSRLIRRRSDAYGVPGLLRWNLNRIWVGKEMLKKGASREEIGRSLKISSYRMNNFIRRARLFEERELYRSYRLLLGTDWQMKSGPGDPRGILERLIIVLCA